MEIINCQNCGACGCCEPVNEYNILNEETNSEEIMDLCYECGSELSIDEE